MIKKFMNIATIVGIALSLATADKWSNMEKAETSLTLSDNQEIVTYSSSKTGLYCVEQPSADIEPTICVESNAYPFFDDLNIGDEVLATFEDSTRWTLTNLEVLEK